MIAKGTQADKPILSDDGIGELLLQKYTCSLPIYGANCMRGIKNIRLKNYDYGSSGYYFITIVSKLRKNIFVDKKGLIERELLNLTEQINGLNIDYFVIMPNHIHLILILEESGLKLGEIIRRFKAKISYSTGENIWQPNYYEHVIRNDKALNKIREYIITNPDAELLKFDEFYR